MSNAADKDTMSELHRKVAEVLIEAMNDEPTAAVISAAIRFLKDNDITTVIEDDEAMSDLKKLLDARKSNSVTAVPVEDEAYALP